MTSNACENYLKGIGQVKRLGGSDRYSTSRVINDYAVANLGFTWDGAALTSGRAPFDALGGGAVQGSKRPRFSRFPTRGVRRIPCLLPSVASPLA